jgi:hypothetical protein
MSKKLSKAQRNIVANVMGRWRETIHEGTPNADKAKMYLEAGYRNWIGAHRSSRFKNAPITFYTTYSPIAFALATAVVRGRMAKERAKEYCRKLGLPTNFLSALRRDTLVSWNERPRRWATLLNAEFSRTWLRLVHEDFQARETAVAQTPGLARRWWGRRSGDNNDHTLYKTNCLSMYWGLLQSNCADAVGISVPALPENQQRWGNSMGEHTKLATEINDRALFGRTSTDKILGELSAAVDLETLLNRERDIENDILENERTDSISLADRPTAIDAEILCKLLKIDDPAMTWEHEVYHHLTTFATFQQSCVILADRPTIHLNDEGQIHCSNGPAVSWLDGTRLWYDNGHLLNESGQLIVTRPEVLTTQRILEIRNEETRRVAIERFGWDRFIVEAGCPVLDRRENEVDNTIEMLVGPPAAEDARFNARRMVLFCRSTGRRYFLTVPNDVENCEQAQAWLSGGATEGKVSYANKPIRLVGAS